MRTVFDDGWKIAGTFDRMSNREHGFDGEVITKHGFVTVWSANSEPSHELNFRFCFNGSEYARRITDSKPFTRKSATILAGKFAREIAWKK